MYQVIKDYFDLRLAEFNAMNSDYLVETSITLNRDRLPLNQRQANYSIKLDNFNSSESQSESYLVSGEVELTFSMVNKKIIDYEAVQEYIYKLARYIRRKENYTSANKHFGIISIGGEDLNNLNEGSTELSTKLVFEGEYYETNAVTLTVPSAPTLTSPADLYLSGLTNQSFQWSDVSGAITYTFELSNTSGVVFTQTGLSVSSYTIPADSLLTNGSVYQWRVRATGEGGNSEWSVYRTLTVNDTGFDADYTNWLAGLTGAQPSSARQVLMNTFIAGLKTDGIWTKLDALWLIANETSEQGCRNLKANKFNLVPIASPTFTVDRGYSTNGTSQYLRLGESPKYQNNFAQNNASFGLYVNTDVNENAVDMGCSWTVFNLLYTRVSNTIVTSINDGGSTPSVANASSVGFYAVDRQASANYKIYKNGTALTTHSFVSTGLNDFEFFIGARNAIGTADRFASKRYAFAFIGKGLSATEHANFYSRVSTLLTAIGAN